MKIPTMNFFRAWKSLRRFQSLDQKQRALVFYAEDQQSYVHFEPIIDGLTNELGVEICYLTSDPLDQILSSSNKKISAFYIGEGTIRTYLFLNLKADVLVMTMPDLEKYFIKRSKVYPVHYAYVFHAIVSTHLAYRKGAFDHFDTLFCVGPHHIEEVRAIEAKYDLKNKNLFEHGYGRLDRLLLDKAQRAEPKSPNDNIKRKKVLLAPTWGENGLLERHGKKLVNLLLEADFDVILRPHPHTLKRWPGVVTELKKVFGSDPRFLYDSDIRTQDAFYDSDCMISDWSGVTFEYAFTLGKPILYVDIDKKMNVEGYQDIENIPVEISIRERIGTIVSLEKMDSIPGEIEKILHSDRLTGEHIEKIAGQYVFNIGESGKMGAEELVRILKEKVRAL